MSRGKADDYPIAPVLREHFGAVYAPDVEEGERRRKMSCPFHEDRTPSAMVSAYGFQCYSCGRIGDAIKLLREEGGLSYADAVRRAKELAGGEDSRIPRRSGWSGISLFDH